MRETLKRVVAGLFALSVLAGCAPRALRPSAPVDLKYKGRPGDSHSYSLTQVFRGRVVNYGMPQLVVLRIRATISERIEEVTDSGWRRVRQASKLEPLEINGMRVEPAGIPRLAETEIMRSPAGEAVPIEAGDPSSDLVIWAARSLGSTFPLLPPAPVVPGEKWRREQEIAVGEQGELMVVTIGELVRVDDEGGRRVAVMRMEGGVNLSAPFEASGAVVETFSLEYKGLVRFDLEEGKIVGSEQEGVLRVKGSFNKSLMEARLNFTSGLVLDEAKEPGGKN